MDAGGAEKVNLVAKRESRRGPPDPRSPTPGHRPLSGIITLTTDFGLSDPYVGMMKGVILGINPAATVVDLTHMIRPQDVVEGAFALSVSYRHFPIGTVHVVVVDPGVGSARSALLIETDWGAFIGPDNGVLSWAAGVPHSQEASAPPRSTITRIIKLTNRHYWLPEVSNTFHGRDVFAPVAAHLTAGVPANCFGEEIAALRELPWPLLERQPDGSVRGSVIHVDRFGNLVTNIPSAIIRDEEETTSVRVAGHRIDRLGRNYDGQGLLTLIGSSGYLEIAVAGGSAAAELGVTRGATVVIHSSRS
jgi:S-adenosyl-L-methionine hydrolase (adenosine-forming)